jgi:hypothetical protein
MTKKAKNVPLTRRYFSPPRMVADPCPSTGRTESSSPRATLRMRYSTSKMVRSRRCRFRAGEGSLVAVLGPDEFCGEGCLTGQPQRMATATAMTECEIMRLDKAAIIRVLHEEPAFSEMFVSHLLARTIRVEADLADQLFNSSEHGGGARPRGVARCSAPLSIRMALGGR